MRKSGQSGTDSKATKKAGTSLTDAPAFLRVAAEWKGYVNVELSEREAEQFRSFSDDVDLVCETTAEVVSRGYKLSFVQTDVHGTVKATAVSGFRGMLDAGYAVSAWQGSVHEALAAVVFLVSMCAQYDLSRYATQGSEKVRRTF